MNKKERIKKLWSEVFGDTDEYVDMYFDRVYRDSDALIRADGGRLDSALLLQPYRFKYQDQDLGASYICGAMTRRQARGKGYMRDLVTEALEIARNRGDMLVALIPAHRWLYFFYDRLGFTTVFYTDPQRFTSLHTFATHGEYTAVEDPYADAVVQAFERFERTRPATILHSRRDYLNILDDNRLDNGTFVAVADADGEICAMAWAVEGETLVTVTELLGRDHDARTGALHELRRHYPGKAFKVLAPPLSEGRRLSASGMCRLVNPGVALRALAKNHPAFKCVIRIKDRLFTDNDGVYVIAEGEVTRQPWANTVGRKLDFDVDVETLSEILFSSAKIGDILDFPTERPVMSLMLS